jgi:uncharacterized protein (TIGR03067 family)
MRSILLAGLFNAFVLLLFSSSALLATEVSDDLAKMQGTWSGKSPEGASLTLVIKDRTAQSTISGKGGNVTLDYEINLDESADPKTMDFLKEGEKPLPAIYRLAGDKLTVCMNVLGGERPTKFGGGKGGGSVVVYSRGTAEATPLGKPARPKPATGDLKPLQGKWQGMLEQAGEREEVLVEIEGNLLTLSKGKGDDLKVVGKSELKLLDIPNPKQIYSKAVDFTPLEGSSAALQGQGLYQVSKDSKSVGFAIRPDGKSRPEKIRAESASEGNDITLRLTRTDQATTVTEPMTDKPGTDQPDPPARRPRPKRPNPRQK